MYWANDVQIAMREAVITIPCGTKVATDAIQMVMREPERKEGTIAMGTDASALSMADITASQ